MSLLTSRERRWLVRRVAEPAEPGDDTLASPPAGAGISGSSRAYAWSVRTGES